MANFQGKEDGGPSGMQFRLKMQPWSDWHEWAHVYHLLFGEMGIVPISSNGEREIDLLKTSLCSETNLKKALNIINMWLLKNVGGDKSKYLKIQKLLLIQMLSILRHKKMELDCDFVESDNNQMALTFRLIQMIEMGAKTAEYKKSKQGGKLSMKNIAEELGFPTFLVQLRH
jgi:Las1-like